MTHSARLTGLYAIADTTSGVNKDLVQQVELALRGGARVIQYRDKSENRIRRLEQAKALQLLCRQARVPLIINDDLELAAAVAADGVHLGCNDANCSDARRFLGPGAIIGISCYNNFENAFRAQAAGADYVAFGRFFPSTTKPLAVQTTLELLTRAGVELEVPTVAIGGITPENGGQLITAGANMLAVIHGIFGQADIVSACADFNRLFAISEASRK